jgi:hypothetical protein
LFAAAFCVTVFFACSKENSNDLNPDNSLPVAELKSYLAKALQVENSNVLYGEAAQQFYLKDYDMRFDLQEVQKGYNESQKSKKP